MADTDTSTTTETTDTSTTGIEKLDDIQKVYFRLKTDDVIYFSQEHGNDDYDGSYNKPKKTYNYSDITQKYVVFLDGDYTYVGGNDKVFIGADYKKCRILKLVNSYNNLTFINLTLYINSYTGITFELKTNVKVYNCYFLNTTGDENAYFAYDNNGFIHVYNSHFGDGITNAGLSKTPKCMYNCTCTENELIDNTGVSNNYTLSTEKALDEDNIHEDLVDTGLETIKDPDMTQSNIGITGGPYYFNGYKKNFHATSKIRVGLNTDTNVVTVAIPTASLDINANNITINSITQKVYNVFKDGTISDVLQEKTINVDNTVQNYIDVDLE